MDHKKIFPLIIRLKSTHPTPVRIAFDKKSFRKPPSLHTIPRFACVLFVHLSSLIHRCSRTGLDRTFKPATYYSSLFANNDKITFCETWRNTSTHYSSSMSSFCEQHANSFGVTKNAFVFCPKIAPSGEDSAECRMKNLVHKTSAKTLHTLFVLRSIFVSSSIFRSCSRIVCSRL